MKSRAELQQWIREGMPVPWGTKPGELCQSYRMGVVKWSTWKWALVVMCRRCETGHTLGGITVTDNGQIAGNAVTANKALSWAHSHAVESGMGADLASREFGAVMNWDRVSEWAIRVMGSGMLSGADGMQGIPMAEARQKPPERGIYLDPVIIHKERR